MIAVITALFMKSRQVEGPLTFHFSPISKILIIDKENILPQNHLEIIDKCMRLRSERNCPDSTYVAFFKNWRSLFK